MEAVAAGRRARTRAPRHPRALAEHLIARNARRWEQELRKLHRPSRDAAGPNAAASRAGEFARCSSENRKSENSHMKNCSLIERTILKT